MAKEQSKKEEKKRFQAWAKRRNVPGVPSLCTVHAKDKKEAEAIFKSFDYLIDGDISKV